MHLIIFTVVVKTRKPRVEWGLYLPSKRNLAAGSPIAGHFPAPLKTPRCAKTLPCDPLTREIQHDNHFPPHLLTGASCQGFCCRWMRVEVICI